MAGFQVSTEELGPDYGVTVHLARSTNMDDNPDLPGTGSKISRSLHVVYLQMGTRRSGI